MALLSVNCLVDEEKWMRMFTVDISPEENVTALKNIIKKARTTLAATDMSNLHLLMPRTPVEGKDPSQVIKVDNLIFLLPTAAKLSSFYTDTPSNHVHIIVKVTYDTFVINCLFLNDHVNKIFQVEVSTTAIFATLKNQIEEKHPERTNLELFQGPLKSGKELVDELATLDIDGLVPLLLVDQISTVFPDVQRNHLHVIVVSPTKFPKRPRSRSPSPSPHDRLKRAKIANEAPSRTAEPAYYENMQNDPSQKLLDDRPSLDANIPPIALLYPPFGTFDDIITDGANVDKYITPEKRQKMENDVDEFIVAMSRFHTDKTSRRDMALPILNRIVPSLIPLKPIYSPALVGDVRSDGHVLGPHHAIPSVVEFQKERPRVVPIVEAVGYFAHSEVKMDKALFERYRMPCLGITVVGADVKFHAILTLGSQQRVVDLTPAYSCRASASSEKARKELFTAFAAASVLLSHIFRDIEGYTQGLPPVITGTHRFPAVSELCKYKCINEYLSFTIEGYYPLRQKYRQLYYARDSSGIQILVKFSQTYCIKLHEYCVEQGHAPKILGFELLAGGWYAIAMEDLSNALPLNDHSLEGEVTTLVKGFHAKGLVHGDLRETNILCSGDKFWLVDYDWGGDDGVVEYPTAQLNPELAAGRPEDLIIRKEDDLRILHNTFTKLKSLT